MDFFVVYVTGKHTVLWYVVYIFMDHTIYLIFQNLGLFRILEAKMSGLSVFEENQWLLDGKLHWRKIFTNSSEYSYLFFPLAKKTWLTIATQNPQVHLDF